MSSTSVSWRGDGKGREPLTSVDVTAAICFALKESLHVDAILDLLSTLKREGRTIIFVSHNMDIVRELSDRVIVMSNGALIAEGDPEEVFVLPEVVLAYLGT